MTLQALPAKLLPVDLPTLCGAGEKVQNNLLSFCSTNSEIQKKGKTASRCQELSASKVPFYRFDEITVLRCDLITSDISVIIEDCRLLFFLTDPKLSKRAITQ